MTTVKNDRSGLGEGDWRGGYYLDEGGQGTVHYWVKVDANGKVIDRMVIKDSWCRPVSRKPAIYEGICQELVRKALDLNTQTDGSSNDDDGKFFQEAYIQGLLTPDSLDTPTNSVRLRGYKMGSAKDPEGRRKTQHWRLYMEHHYHGDLEDFIYGCITKDEDGEIQKTPIPEPFIWWVLKCLTTALVEMEQRPQALSPVRKKEQQAVVMIDLKPANILLSTPGGPEFPVYPKPLITDFGSAYLTHTSHAENEFKALGFTCTSGFYAPEIKTADDEDEEMYDEEDEEVDEEDDEAIAVRDLKRVSGMPVYSWTNVWQLGRCIECLMRLRPRLSQVQWEDDVDRRESDIQTNPPFYDEVQYSDDLLEIVWQCQRFSPKDRPTPVELLDIINKKADAHVKEMDSWGTETWIEAHEKIKCSTTAAQKKTIMARSKERRVAGKLYFLRDYQDQDLAERYEALDIEIPEDCELSWKARKFKWRIGQEGPPAETKDLKRRGSDAEVAAAETPKKKKKK